MIQFMRGNSSSVISENPVLAAGQPFFETDTGILKIGDGSTDYNNLRGVGRSKTYNSVIVGSALSGYTSADVDYLCTGENDDIVINQAIASLSSTGGQVRLLSGTYNINSVGVQMTAAGVTLTGEGKSSTILDGSSLTSSVFSSNVVYLHANNSELCHLTVKGSTSRSDFPNIHMGLQTYINIHDCSIQDCGDINIELNSTKYVRITNCDITNCSTAIAANTSSNYIICSNCFCEGLISFYPESNAIITSTICSGNTRGTISIANIMYGDNIDSAESKIMIGCSLDSSAPYNQYTGTLGGLTPGCTYIGNNVNSSNGPSFAMTDDCVFIGNSDSTSYSTLFYSYSHSNENLVFTNNLYSAGNEDDLGAVANKSVVANNLKKS